MTDGTDKINRHQIAPDDLRASEIRYRRLFESARDGILILDADSRKITDVNPYMVEFLEYSRDEFLGKELWEIGLFGDKDQSQVAFRELQATGYIRYEDMPLQTKAGKLWNVEFVSNVYLEDGRRVIQCNIRDITERKRAEEMRLWHSTIFETSHEGILVEDDERIHYVNKAYLRLFGYDDPEELIGQHVSVVISSEDRERLLGFGASRLRGEQPPAEYEFKGRRKDGSRVDVEASITASQVAGRNYITTMIRDITERKRADEALRESEARFRAAFEQANVGIVQASSEGRLLVVNPGFCKIIGYPEAAARGMMIRDITHGDDYEKEAELTRRLTAGEIPGYSIEKRYLHRDGHLVWGQMTATLVRRASGEPYYMLAIVEDISERKRAEEALLQLNERLEQRVAERTVELMGMNASLQAEIVERRRAERERASILRRLVMAQEEERRRIARDMHDQFGQQLTLLLLKLGMLKEDCGGQGKLCGQVEELERVAGQLDADVDFLVWELRPTVLDDLGLQEALTNFAQNWSKHFGIPVEVLTHGLEKAPSTSEIDTMLYRIAQEALNNVAKHAGAVGVSVLLEGRADAVSLIVEDDGVGFDAEDTSGANVKGLGLVGMRERAALVGGTAEVESHPGEGTRVIVRIPALPGGTERRGA